MTYFFILFLEFRPVFMNNSPLCHISKQRVLNYKPNSVETTFVVKLVCVLIVQMSLFGVRPGCAVPLWEVEIFLEFACYRIHQVSNR